MHEIRIAIAEDVELVRQGIIAIINDFPGCKVVADAENGAVLITKINELDKLPDIVLLDVSMPVMDGYATALQLSRSRPDVRLIAISSYNEVYTISRMIQNGVHAYLYKNSSPKELYRAIMEVYSNG